MLIRIRLLHGLEEDVLDKVLTIAVGEKTNVGEYDLESILRL